MSAVMTIWTCTVPSINDNTWLATLKENCTLIFIGTHSSTCNNNKKITIGRVTNKKLTNMITRNKQGIPSKLQIFWQSTCDSIFPQQNIDKMNMVPSKESSLLFPWLEEALSLKLVSQFCGTPWNAWPFNPQDWLTFSFFSLTFFSRYSVTLKLNVMVMRMKAMITNLRSIWFSYKFSLPIP